MKRTIFLLIAVIAGISVFFLSRNDSEDGTGDVAALARERARKEAVAEANAIASQSDLAVLAKQSKGQPLPEYLASDVDPYGRFWLVGNPESEFGVEIPFEPGNLPAVKSERGARPNKAGFLGAESCQECHADKYESFIETAHHRTSRVATLDEISGPLSGGKNRMRTLHPEIGFEMLERDEVAYQRVSFFGWQF